MVLVRQGTIAHKPAQNKTNQNAGKNPCIEHISSPSYTALSLLLCSSYLKMCSILNHSLLSVFNSCQFFTEVDIFKAINNLLVDKSSRYFSEFTNLICGIWHYWSFPPYNSLLPSVQFSSVAQSCPTLCDPMNCSTPGLPVHHQLPEFTQTHVHWVCDAIQPSHPGSSPSPPAPNPSQHQSLFQWVRSSHEVSKVLELQL